MPCWELFANQDEAYRESVLPKGIRKRVTVEAASPLGWHRWAGDEGAILAIDRYGASAPGEEILRHYGFTPEHVTAAALRVLGRNQDADLALGSAT
jgi:transketolase